MKAFVIDEGVLHLALAGRDEDGVVDWTAVAFLTEVWKNGHTLCWSPATLERIRRKLKHWEDQNVPGLNVVMLFSQSIIATRRSVEVDVTSVNLPDGIPRKDEDWVRVAVARRSSILVTQDEPLREAIRDVSLTSQGVRIVSVEEGLVLARDPDC